MSRVINLNTHSIDEDQLSQLTRALSYFNDSQKILRLVNRGPITLPATDRYLDVGKSFAALKNSQFLVVATGLPLSDNWFTHAQAGCGLMTLAGWEVAFRDAGQNAPGSAPDANILTSLALVVLLVLANSSDWELLHEDLTGCLFDLCAHKPERIHKMRAAYVCHSCTSKLASRGVSSVELDAIVSVLDCVRHLTLGRRPQSKLPVVPDDEEFLRHAALPQGLSFPPRLVTACRNRSILVLIGSGMSLQSDVAVEYAETLTWKQLPSWTEVPLRLAESLRRYRGKAAEPRTTETLDEFLADLDYFRDSLGESIYYPRAIFDIFAPQVRSVGLANRLVFRLPLKSVLTTNYDFVLQCAAPPGTPVFTWRESRHAREYLAGGGERRPIIKIHGCASRPDTVVLTRLEYAQLAQQEEYRSTLRALFEDQNVLFVGFGLNDPRDLDSILRESRLAGAAEGEKFALLPESRCGEIRDKFPQVQTIPYKDHSQLASIIGTLVTTSA